jgi:hypothetical protein
MQKIAFLVFLTVALVGCRTEGLASKAPEVPATDYPGSMAEVVNHYRREQGLPAIPVSASLTLVAKAHVKDLQNANPVGGRCNIHSWSNKGNWSPCCYTNDHAKAECMRKKPSEITRGVYSGNGYEISVVFAGKMTPNIALYSWQGSRLHHDVILNRNKWRDMRWNAMGGAVSENYAVVWFGKEPDPAGSP